MSLQNDEPLGLRLFADKFCPSLTLENGKPFLLYPEQRIMLREYFGGIRETLILLSKKNGKTTLLSALALYHLVTTENATCFIAAASRDQATILYDQARGFVKRSDWLQEEVVIKAGYRQIRSTRDSGIIRVLAADADTADGVIPTLGLVDELGRQKSASLYGIFRDGLEPRNGQMVAISTAGDAADSPLGQLRATAYAMGVKQEGTYRHVATENFALHEWALDQEDDFEDFDLVKSVNPLPLHTPATLKKVFNSPSMQLWQWRRFRCGQWGVSEFGVIDPRAWEACGRGKGIAEGVPCWVGLDLGWRRFTTAIVPFVYDQSQSEGQQEIVGVPTVLVPPPKGEGELKPSDVIAEMKKIHTRNPIEAVVFDPGAEGHILAELISSELDIDIIEHSQHPAPMSQSSMALAEAIRARRIIHPDDETLTKHVLNAASKAIAVGSDKWRFVAQSESMPIDAAIALAIVRRACVDGLGTKQQRKPISIEEMRELYGAAA